MKLTYIAIAATLAASLAAQQQADNLAKVPAFAPAPQSILGDAATPPAQSGTSATSLDRDRVRIHTHEEDPDGGAYGTWAAGGTYKVSFHDGFTFVPYLGGKYPHNQPWSWRTTSARVGSKTVLDRAAHATVTRHSDFRYEYATGDFVEAYDVLVAGAEQTFTLMTKPAVAGDFVVEGSITTGLHADRFKEHGKIAFRDNNGHVILYYGAAKAVDADGNEIAIRTRFDGQSKFTLTVPASFVQGAAFPLTIDPLLTRTEAFYWNTLALTSTGTVRDIDIARDDRANDPGIGYIREASATDSDLWFKVFTDDTMTTNNTLFTDITASWGNKSCAVTTTDGSSAATGRQWVLAFVRIFSTANGARIHTSPSGSTTLATNYRSVSRPSGSSVQSIDVGGETAFTSTARAFIVYDRTLSGTNSGVYGNLLNLSSGSLVVGAEVRLTSSASGRTYTRLRPRINEIAGSGTDGWAVCFQEYWDARSGGGDDWDIVIRRVSTAGAMMGGAVYTSMATPDDRHKLAPVIEGRNGRYIVAFVERNQATLTKVTSAVGNKMWAQRVDWPSTGSGSNGNLCDSIHKNFTTSLRWRLTDLAFDNRTSDHWAAMMHSTSSGTQYCAMLGFDAGATERLTAKSGTGSTGTIGGAVTFDDDARKFQMTYATKEGSPTGGTHSHPVYVQILEHFANGTITSYGTACGSASISSSGTALRGSSNFAIRISGAPANTGIGYLLAVNSGNLPLGGIGMTGCALNLDPSLIVLSISVTANGSGSATIPFPLGACPNVLRGTLYHQFAYLNPGANPLGVQATKGLKTKIE